nr:hypothetical protein [Tanacetum cinerariifolium]
MEYLVNISKRRAFWSLNKDILKITILNTNTPYPSRKIRRIRACTHQRPQRKQDQYVDEVSPKSKNDMPLQDRLKCLELIVVTTKPVPVSQAETLFLPDEVPPKSKNDMPLRDKGAIPSKTAADAKVAIQEMAEYSQKRHNGTSRSRRASVSVIPLSTYLNLGLGELAHIKLTVELADRTVKYPKGIAENMLVSIGKFVFLVEFITLDMPEDIKVPLILGRPFLSTSHAMIGVYKRKITLRVREERSLNDFFEDYIELNDLNKPFELRRNQGDDLMPTIEEGEDKMECKGNNVVGTLMNIPIFVGTLEYMDAYRDEGMGDVIFGEPFLREVGIKTRRFEGMITIYNGNDEVIYQMVGSHLRFKHHTNEQCNKILPLLKVSEEDMMNGISHPYQKLKGFYKGVLNLGPDYIRDVKIEEWLTRGHISVHEME